jgi:ATP-dependent RNA helicase SUPV3L1/SUV3
MTDASAITALLGPTNTGKTHRAVERMLEHASGMIGLPLRLLAREVYDRVTARVGEARVALVTGEEQRIPARPSYWICTVEAMPVDRAVEFLAVDEVQLAAHDQRGHVFTSRILSARGTKETWLLGAGTMRPVLRELVPTARHVEHPRLSRLSYAGTVPLARVPPRSAVVAFSVPHVYEIAERIRARKGGAAVVLGALSPRTRNAQVAMFQAGEVDWLVATDAIGMGLNLDLEHVAFGALRKFDGRDVRDVDEAELAQIAGRAGRYVQDGTFGAITPLDVPAGVVAAIEGHHFAPIKRVRWRSDALDFASVSALRESLHAPSTRKVLAKVLAAEDSSALDRLALRDDVTRAARGEEAVRLLWDVCTVPDFRKLLLDVHVDFLERLYLELSRRGRLSDDWIAGHVRELEKAEGDVETLVARIAAVRTWTYVANRESWLASPREWQEKTRALEDRLSDALHDRLVMRFVDVKKGRAGVARAQQPRVRKHHENRRDAGGDGDGDGDGDDSDAHAHVAEGHPFAKLAALRSALAPRPSGHGRAQVHGHAAAGGGSSAWVEEVVESTHAELRLDGSGAIMHTASNRPIARVSRGSSIALPDVRVLEGDDFGAGAQRRLHRRALAFARDVVSELLGGARELALASTASSTSVTASAAVRGLVHRLEQGLGTVLARDVADVCAVLDDAARDAVARAGIVLGPLVVFVPAGLGPEAITARVALATAWYGAGRALRPPAGGAVSFPTGRGIDVAAYAAIGFPVLGPRAVRADVAARVAARLAAPPGDVGAVDARHADTAPADTEPADTEIASWLGCTTREVRRVVEAIAGAVSEAGTSSS